MIILGLTGSIAMGKSHATRIIRALGVPVFDADRAAHGLMAAGGAAVDAVRTRFPGTAAEDGGIDRKRLGRIVFEDGIALRALEAILHPRIRDAERVFLEHQCRTGRRISVLDIPLLLETGGERRVDRVAVVSAHPLLQRQRALARPGMDAAKLRAVLAKQLPDPIKRRRADYVIPSGRDRGLTIATIAAMLNELAGHSPRAWASQWQRHARSGETR